MLCLGVCDWVSSIDLMLPGPRGGGHRGERSRITMTGLMDRERERGREEGGRERVKARGNEGGKEGGMDGWMEKGRAIGKKGGR